MGGGLTSEWHERSSIPLADSVGTTQLKEPAVGSSQLYNDSVGSQHLANNAISYGAQIKDNIIGYGELTTGLQGSLGGLTPDSVGTTQLKEPSVGSSQLYKPAVGSANIYTGAVYGAKIANDAVGSQHLANNAVSYAAQIKDGIVGYAELTTGLQGSLGGAPGPDSVGTTQLKEPSVGSSQLYKPAVGSANIYSQAVYAAKIKNNTIGSQQLANSSVIGTKIASNAVGYGKLTTGLQGTYMPVTGGTFTGSVDYSGNAKPPRLAVLTPGGAIPTATLGATGTAVHSNITYYEQRFNPGTINSVWWEFQVPSYYDAGTLNFNVWWKGYPATGTVVWSVACIGRTTNEVFDTAPVALGSKLTNTQGSAKVTKSIITGKPDFIADELAVVKLSRIGWNTKDTLAGSASLLMVSIDFKAVK